MGDYKPLMYSLIFIFLVGGLLVFLLEPFVDIDELSEDTWIQTFYLEEIVGFIFEIFNYILTAITWVFEAIRFSLFDLFTTPPPETQSYVVSGSGFYNGITLDGLYIWTHSNRYVNVNNSNIWLNVDDPDMITEIKVRSNIFVTAVLRWIGVYETIYISDSTWNNLILLKTDYDFNSVASVSVGGFQGEESRPPFEAVGRVREFINEAKELTIQRVKIMGVIPQEIGIPIMIIIIIGSLITIIKLLPWT